MFSLEGLSLAVNTRSVSCVRTADTGKDKAMFRECDEKRRGNETR